MPSLRELEQAFWAKVRRCRHGKTCRRCCWEWQGPFSRQGYGVYFIGSPVHAHRFILETLHGALILGRFVVRTASDGSMLVYREGGGCFCVMHHCDNPPCVNPSHIRLATYSDNIRDAIQKGRWHNGRMPKETPHA